MNSFTIIELVLLKTKSRVESCELKTEFFWKKPLKSMSSGMLGA